MGKDTAIQWCDSTVNGTTGCDGCELKVPGKPGTCYAVPIHENRLAYSFPALYSKDFHEVRLAPGRIPKTANWSDLRGKDRAEKPWLNNLPRTIFLGDMGDMFSKDVPFQFIYDEVVRTAISKNGYRHIYMILTKQAQRLGKFQEWMTENNHEWPKNLWSGVSVTSSSTLSRANVFYGMTGVRYLSVEPLWSALTIPSTILKNVSLVIVGGESGPKAKPFELDWARSLRDQCLEARVPFFLKQLGAYPVTDSVHRISKTLICLKDSHGGDPSEWPADLQDCRQFPSMSSLRIGLS